MTPPLQLVLPLLLLPLSWVTLAEDVGALHAAVPGFVPYPGLESVRFTTPGTKAAEAVTAEVESLLEPPIDVGPPADAAAERLGATKENKQEKMRGLQDRYAASHAGSHHDMNSEVFTRRPGHQPSEVEDLRSSPIVGGGRISDVETIPEAELNARSEKPPAPSIDDDNDFLREDGWEPKRPLESDVLGDTENDKTDLTSGTDTKSPTSESANNGDDNDFLRSDRWETRRPQEEAVTGERTNTVLTQAVSRGDTESARSSGNSDDDNDFLRDDTWEAKPAPEVTARDDKSAHPAVDNNADDLLRDDTAEAAEHKPVGAKKNVDSSIASAPDVSNGDNKYSATPISNNVDDNEFLRDDTLETVLTKPAVTVVNTASSRAPNHNYGNEKFADHSGGKSNKDNGFLRGDDHGSKPQPARIGADVEAVPSSGVSGSDDTAGNNVDDNEPAVRGGRNADIDDEEESPNHGPQGSHKPDEHVRKDREEDTDHRHGDYGEDAHKRHEEDKDAEEEGDGDHGEAGEGRKDGEEDLAWAGRSPLDGNDWPKWAGGDGPHGATPPKYSGGGVVGGLADGEKLPDEDRHQRQAPAPRHQVAGGPWVQQWLARGAAAGAGGGGKAAEAAGAAAAARRAAHRSSFRRGWKGSGSRDTAHDESWGRRREYHYALPGGVAGGDRSADLLAGGGGGGLLWQPWGPWHGGMLYL